MKILAIETSSDDTAIAVLKARKTKRAHFNILSNIVSSQIAIHQKYGGIYPALAKREHQRNLIPVLKKALQQSNCLNAKLKVQNSKLTQDKIKKLKIILKREERFYPRITKFLLTYQKPKIEAIAVTVGPGLEPCLWTGINFAKGLSFFWNLPTVPVNHLEGHILANFIGKNSQSQIPNSELLFPAICLVVSGGHTQLILMKNIGQYQILGETRDDAAGECFDKTARLLGFEYPGGPVISQLARAGRSQIPNSKLQIKLPRPMLYSKNYDFSFSGLKTAVLYDFKKRSSKEKKSKQYVQVMAYEIQQAIIDVLVKKTIQAAQDYRVKTIILGGGVAANEKLRKQLNENCKLKIENCRFLAPPKSFCTDNALMIALAAFYHRQKKVDWHKVKAQANLRL